LANSIQPLGVWLRVADIAIPFTLNTSANAGHALKGVSGKTSALRAVPLSIGDSLALRDGNGNTLVAVKESSVGATASLASKVNLPVSTREAIPSIPEGILRAETLGVLAVPNPSIGAGGIRQAGLPIIIGASGACVS
jgi:hypothetical protein